MHAIAIAERAASFLTFPPISPGNSVPVTVNEMHTRTFHLANDPHRSPRNVFIRFPLEAPYRIGYLNVVQK
jgi:hypothetical protein